MRTTQSDLDSQSSHNRVEPGIHSRSEASQTSLTIRLARGSKRWHPCLPEEDMGQEEFPSLSICLSIYLKLTTNCVPLLRIK